MENIERGIYKTPSGTFTAKATVMGIRRAKTFTTIEEARKWRDEIHASNPKPKGWNFRKGQKDHLKREMAMERGRKGGEVQTPKGFADIEVQVKSQIQRKINRALQDGE